MTRVGDSVDLLPAVEQMVGQALYEETAEFPVERGYIWTTCSAVENGNPLFWDDEVAEALTAGPIAPPTMLSVWFRPHHWAPGRSAARLPLQVHFDLKEALGLPEAVMSDNTMTFFEPVRIGDLLTTRQVLRSVSDEKVTKLGIGRFWVIDVEYENQNGTAVGMESYTGFGYRKADGPSFPGAAGAEKRVEARDVRAGSAGSSDSRVALRVANHGASERAPGGRAVPAAVSPRLLLADLAEGDRLPTLSYDVSATTVVLGALASRDWRPMHHDKDFAVNRNGTKDIFLNTPNQAAWFERYVTDWTGPHGRLGRMSFRMSGSVFPGDRMDLNAVVNDVEVDEASCGWVGLDVTLSVNSTVKTTCVVKVAVPVDGHDNPWARRAEDSWRP